MNTEASGPEIDPIERADSHYLTVVIPAYRDAERALEAAAAMAVQKMPDGVLLEVLIIDDGSDDGSTSQLSAMRLPSTRVIFLPTNCGRSVARNEGARCAKGEFIVFMDCDCLPSDQNFLAEHHAAFSEISVVACTGNVKGIDSGFWSRYQERASNRRKKQHAGGESFSGSSQNLSVRRELFDSIGGFDIGYTSYGFEDRDLLLRLAELGTVTWSDKATVLHRDQFSMQSVLAKMRLAGGASAARFSKLHPRAYRVLGYAQLDARQHPWWRLVAPFIEQRMPKLTRRLESAINANLLPFAASAFLMKLLVGLTFMLGTCYPSTSTNQL